MNDCSHYISFLSRLIIWQLIYIVLLYFRLNFWNILLFIHHFTLIICYALICSLRFLISINIVLNFFLGFRFTCAYWLRSLWLLFQFTFPWFPTLNYHVSLLYYARFFLWILWSGHIFSRHAGHQHWLCSTF